jgi:hypothetical protein
MSFRKRQRSASSSRLAAFLPPSPPPPSSASPSSSLSFPNADIILRLRLDPSRPDDAGSDSDCGRAVAPDLDSFLDLHVSSASLLRSRYFATQLSDRWSPAPSAAGGRLTLEVPASSSCPRPFHAHVEVLRLLHTLHFAGAIRSPGDALDLLPVALQLLFDVCVRFLEAVPWSEEEEARVLDLAPLLPADEAADLLARVSPPTTTAPGSAAGEARSPSEAMLHGLIHSAIHGHPVHAATKAFVAMLLKNYPSRDCIHKVLDEAFLSRLETVKELMGKYASPDFRVAVDSDEREAIQRLNLQSAVLNVKHLYWLIERMVDMRVADNAVKLWSDQAALATDLQKLLNDADMWRNMTPGLPMLVTRCTLRLANSVVIGETLVPRQVCLLLTIQCFCYCKRLYMPLCLNPRLIDWIELFELVYGITTLF